MKHTSCCNGSFNTVKSFSPVIPAHAGIHSNNRMSYNGSPPSRGRQVGKLTLYITLLLALFLLTQPTAKGEADTVVVVKQDTVWIAQSVADSIKAEFLGHLLDTQRSQTDLVLRNQEDYMTKVLWYASILVAGLLTFVGISYLAIFRLMLKNYQQKLREEYRTELGSALEQLQKELRDEYRQMQTQLEKQFTDSEGTLKLMFSAQDHHIQAAILVASKVSPRDEEKIDYALEAIKHWTMSIWIITRSPIIKPEEIPFRNLVRLALDGIHCLARKYALFSQVNPKYHEMLSSSLAKLSETDLKEDHEFEIWFREINQWIEHPDELLDGTPWQPPGKGESN